MLRSLEERVLDNDESSPSKKHKTSHTTSSSSMWDKGLFYFINAPTYFSGNIEKTLNEAITSGDANQVKTITNGYYKPPYDSTYLLYVTCDLEILKCILLAYTKELSHDALMSVLLHYVNSNWIDGAKLIIESIGQNQHYYFATQDIDDLLEAISILSNADISCHDSKDLYQLVFKHAPKAKEFKHFFRKLTTCKIPYHDNEALYLIPFKAPWLMQEVESFFSYLQHSHIYYHGNEALYDLVIANPKTAKWLSEVFLSLNKRNIPYQGYETLYKLLINNLGNNCDYIYDIAESFLALNNGNILFHSNIGLYKILIKRARYSKELTEIFLKLNKENFPYQGKEALYKQASNDPLIFAKIAKYFVAFSNENITYSDNEGLYKLLILQPYYAEELTNAFITLFKGNLPYQGNETLYKLLVDKIESSSIYICDLAEAFLALKDGNILFQDNKGLYKIVFENAMYAKKLTKIFLLLNNMNIPYQGNEGLYKLLILEPYNAEKLTNVFIMLIKGNLPYQGNETLYEQFIKAPFWANEIAQGVLMFKNVFPYQGNEGLYSILFENYQNVQIVATKILNLYNQDIPSKYIEMIFKNSNESETISLGFALLKSNNIPCQGNEALYEMMSANVNEAHKIAKMAVRFAALNIPLSYLTLNSLRNKKLAIYNCNKLIEAGYSYQFQPIVFDVLLQNFSNPNCDYVISGKTVKDLIAYAKYHSLQTTDDLALTEIIESNKNFWEYLSSGPLKESNANKMIEHLLQQIGEVNINEHTLLHFNAFEDYILSLPAQKEINLSLLIRNANFSQLVLEDSLIEKIGNIVKELLPAAKTTSKNQFIKLMPEAHRRAIKLYITEKYKNINKFFRSEPLDISAKYEIHPDLKHHMLLCFLLGCLINDAINKLNNLVDVELPEKVLLNKIAAKNNVFLSEYAEADKLNALLKTSFKNNIIDEGEYDSLIKIGADNLIPLFNTKKQLDRGELLEKQHISARLAGVWKLPALTSLSVLNEGSPYFHKQGTYRSKFENAPNFYVINQNEGEILLAQGEYVITYQGPECLISTIVRSPDIATPNHLKSEMALSYAHENYLTKNYSEEKDSILLNNIEVVRPYHNSTHTYRVMLAIECVTRYFAYFAKDVEFKHFCLSLTEGNLEYLRVAAAFSITGRESEIAASDDLKRYDAYRIASAEHFKKYNLENGDNDLSVHQTLYEIIRFMGNPEYENKLNTQKDETENKYRNFYHRILTIAHKLDLPRCYNVSAFQKSMQHCYDLSEKSEEQQEALNDIIRYMIELIKAHGGALSCDMEMDGSLIDVDVNFQDIYAQTSNSLKKLFDATQTVPKPDQNYDKKVHKMKLC